MTESGLGGVTPYSYPPLTRDLARLVDQVEAEGHQRVNAPQGDPEDQELEDFLTRPLRGIGTVATIPMPWDGRYVPAFCTLRRSTGKMCCNLVEIKKRAREGL